MHAPRWCSARLVWGCQIEPNSIPTPTPCFLPLVPRSLVPPCPSRPSPPGAPTWPPWGAGVMLDANKNAASFRGCNPGQHRVDGDGEQPFEE